ncbi:MAG: hypothetical protein R3B70_20965 [Polyangiaceae bacterium]
MIEPRDAATSHVSARPGWGGVVLGVLGGLGLLAAGALFARDVYYYNFYVRPAISGLRPHSVQGVWCEFAYEEGNSIAKSAGAVGAWFAALAIAALLFDILSRRAAPEPRSGGGAYVTSHTRHVAALLASAAFLAVGAFSHLSIERFRRWTEWAAIATIALAGLLGALRAWRGHRPSRLPRALLPVTLAMSAVFFSVADAGYRWATGGGFLQGYGYERAIPDDEVETVRKNQPIGALIFLTPALVLLSFGAWTWAEGSRRGPSPKSRIPLALVIGTSVMLVGYGGLDRRLRKDMAAQTGGTGSFEDFIAFARIAHYVPPKPVDLFEPPPEPSEPAP